GLVINEAAAKLMGMTTPVGHSVTWDQVKEKPFKILGVVKNMVMESPFAKASPTLFFIYRRDGANYMFLKINPGINAGVALSTFEAVFKKVNPSTIFEYSFVTDEFSKKFEAEERISTLSSLFALLAIIISCLGLFGLASFVAEQRTKEIGVRKVLGASAWNIWSLISKDFVALFMISFLISAPVAYYFMDNWLQNYAVRTPLSWWIFALGGMGTLILILCTVSFQALKAAMVDPVKSLRTE
ncbi:MAG: FtsX-like permease family protein, partial [Chitinophagaceae bacterium]